jgi:riboflavin synthase
MFTGLVQKLGKVLTVVPDGHGGATLAIEADYDAVLIGESIAVNGCCLTMIAPESVKTDTDDSETDTDRHGEDSDPASPCRSPCTSSTLVFQAGPETLAKTCLGSLKATDRVNLERALRMGEPLGGHIVTGHVDAVGTIRERTASGEWQNVWFDCPASLDELMVHKGSIAVDGVSLTLVDVEPGKFSVMLIPHTLAHTTLGFKDVGDPVNLEADLIAKHVKKLFANLSIEI